MAIVRKEHLQIHLYQLEKYYQELRHALEGEVPSPNNSHAYNCEAEQFQREFTNVDLEALNYAILHFDAAVKGLKAIKAIKAQPNHRT